jgi:8-amino-7-oxononanoate synthase
MEKEKTPKNILLKLQNRVNNNSLRSLINRDDLVDFSSNDYLGLAKNVHLAAAIEKSTKKSESLRLIGSTGSRLLRGNSQEAEDVEKKIATFHEVESATLFNSGYDANVGFISALASKDDVYLYDTLIHASMHDGMKLSKAQLQAFPHNDIEWLNNYEPENKGDVFLLTEAIFSMDGDETPLQRLSEICHNKGWYFIVDEAHAIAIKSDKGEGLAQNLNIHHQLFARIITYGKGPGVHGAAILGSEKLKSFLINFARSFIYSTAMPPHQLHAIDQSYKFFAEMQSGRNYLHQIINEFNVFAQHEFGNNYISSTSAIHSIIVGGNEKTRAFSAFLNEKGFDIRPILSPTVPRSTERIRICLHIFNQLDEINRLKKALLEAKNKFLI